MSVCDRWCGLSTLVLYAVLPLLFACNKKTDACEQKLCYNGGVCVDGACVCANGYTGFNCETIPNACGSVVCLNGGACENDSCVCAPGYTGADCGTQETPSAIRVNAVTVTSFPAANGGASWDTDSGPDIYPEIKLGPVVIWTAPEPIQDADPAQDHTFTLDPTFDLNSPTSLYTITLFDQDDLDPDDVMGSVEFTPYSSTNAFPSTLTIAPAGAEVTFTMEVSYIW